MADETTIAKIETKAVEAAEAVKAPVQAVAEKAKEVAAKPVRKAKAAVAKRRAAKSATKTVKAVRNLNKKATKTATAAIATPFERIETMTYDFNKLFAGFELPGADRFQALFADAGARGQEIVAKSQKTAEELAELAKANVEALTESGRIAASGARTLGQELLASGRDGFEQASGAMKTLADAKSPTEFIQIQSELARTNFDRVVAESSKFAEAFVKLAGEAIQPISNRATLNAERIGELAA
ncbi:phasin family protein [Sphingomonas sp. HDW15A]|uniref:phasin family protein n=1 Tax=Sphingomonas sp. HDW15A TaxID=2714942 RepID=UPI00140A86D8|nr:phasin family protein [Sphingomonas sp. HDW15A]QIK95258.1 phasin family protein [Sphingomonas sp. HDW15A]